MPSQAVMPRRMVSTATGVEIDARYRRVELVAGVIDVRRAAVDQELASAFDAGMRWVGFCTG